MNIKKSWYTIIGAVAVMILAMLTYILATAPPAIPTEAPTSNLSPLANPTSSVALALPSAKTAMVMYANGAFSPNPITIKAGGTVTFMNNSSGDIRVASDPHPTHTGYPVTGGCVGGRTFDSCGPIATGASWSFTFDIIGSWGYHNHFSPGDRGMVIVQ